MSEQPVWTLEALKLYFDQRFADLHVRTSDAKHSIERAEDQAAQTRLYAESKSNEFREQLADQANMFMPRAESDQRYATTIAMLGDQRAAAQKAIDDLRDSTDKDNKEMAKKFEDLKVLVTETKSSQSGRAGGLKDNMALILALVTIAGFVLLLIRK